MRDEHGMLRKVYIYCHGFCHTFRWYENESSMGCLGRYTFFVMTSVILSGVVKMRDEHGMLREVYICTLFFFAASFTASFAAFWEALSFAASFAAFRQLLCHTLCAQKQIDKNTWLYKDKDSDNNNTRTNT